LSSISVDISKTTCPSCRKKFYEFSHSLYSNCPFCGSNLAESGIEQEFETITLEIDPHTGEIKQRKG